MTLVSEFFFVQRVMNSYLLKSSKHLDNEFTVDYIPIINDQASLEWKLTPAGGCLNLSECYMTFHIDVPEAFVVDNWLGTLVSANQLQPSLHTHY